ncbi:store-operated calcium entry-associated regulatory factor-like [Lytechinus variegatus]|uniref:store-operated calcium entry-associated regulatory factor-like n=1 Tax=Lytechinus variegatus TaxID=7654 RepID=UPI001BB26315|nr:store-operated calcium entry-associated regulatory factor-like [Lytechinus variegatus]
MKASIVVCSVFIVSLSGVIEAAFGFGKSDRVRLEDISVLTLKHGKMTTGRRSSPVKQLQCVGGSAAHAFTPQVVQCYNRGSDGYDVQWECKTDMDNAYRFGQIEVICEGYSSPDDEYILKGSCGLEYTLEYTKEGMNQKNSGGNYHSYYGNDDGSYDNYYNQSRQKSGKTDWLFLAIVAVLMYVIYRTCIASTPNESGTAGSDDGYPGQRGTGFGPGGGGGAPPPPGFRDDGYSGGSCSGTQGHSSGYTRGAGTGGGGLGGGGFWTGAAAGGLLGYLFGGNRNRGYGYGGYGRPRYGYTAPRYNSGFSSGWGSSSRSSGFSGFGGGGSSGTRTASGFGGTRRR